MTTAEYLKNTAAYLLSEAAKLEGKPLPSAFDVNNPATWWPAMLAQFENEAKPHAYVQWQSGVLPEQAGTGEDPPRSYDTHRMLWEAAQRGDPTTMGGVRIRTGGNWGWPDARGEAFRIFDHIPNGPDAVHEAIEQLFYSPVGRAWTASMVGQYPKLGVPPSRF